MVHEMPNPCDTLIQRNLELVQWRRISNGRKERGSISSCINGNAKLKSEDFYANLRCSRHTAFNGKVFKKALSRDVLSQYFVFWSMIYLLTTARVSTSASLFRIFGAAVTEKRLDLSLFGQAFDNR